MQRVGLALLCSLVVLLCGCPFGQAKHSGNWPVAQLTALPNATLLESESPAAGGQVWTNKYHCDRNPHEAFKHVESCLKPLNYEEFWMESTQGKTLRDILRDYYSPDHLTKVTVMVNPKASWASDPDKPNVTIKIELFDKPDVYVQAAGSTSSDGTKMHLEPIQ